MMRVSGDRVFVAGHGAPAADRWLAGPFGAGAAARSAVVRAELPFALPVEIETALVIAV
jgi:hypothetical protein